MSAGYGRTMLMHASVAMASSRDGYEKESSWTMLQTTGKGEGEGEGDAEGVGDGEGDVLGVGLGEGEVEGDGEGDGDGIVSRNPIWRLVRVVPVKVEAWNVPLVLE